MILSGPHSARIETFSDGCLSTSMNYITFQHVVRGMPRRPGDLAALSASESTVLLAFPLWNRRPYLMAQQTYAFLPMNYYGFKVTAYQPPSDLVDSNSAVSQPCGLRSYRKPPRHPNRNSLECTPPERDVGSSLSCFQLAGDIRGVRRPLHLARVSRLLVLNPSFIP